MTLPEAVRGALLVGRTLWSARVPPDPPSDRSIEPVNNRERPKGASGADQGVRPAVYSGGIAWKRTPLSPRSDPPELKRRFHYTVRGIEQGGRHESGRLRGPEAHIEDLHQAAVLGLRGRRDSP